MDGVEIVGTFDAARWLETAAKLLARRHGVEIEVRAVRIDQGAETADAEQL